MTVADSARDRASPVSAVGLVGVGHMGAAIARRLLASGHPLVVHDTRAAAVDALVAAGAIDGGSVAAIADRCAIVLTCLPSVDACVAVAAALAGGRAVTRHVELSTIGRAGIARVADAHRDVATIDAPISGGPKGAAAGTLSTMLAGEVRDLDAVRPIVEAYASRIFVMGHRVGDAQVAKIVNNALSIGAMVASCEAVVLGVKAGLDAHRLIDAINAGTGRNSATVDKFPKAILPRTFDYGGPLGIGLKDLELYRDEAEAEGFAPGAFAHATAVWRDAVAELGPDVDLTTIVRWFERRAGVEVGVARPRDGERAR